MAEETPSPAVPGVIQPAPAPESAGNAAFAEMRTKLAASEREKADLSERLTALERRDMAEKDRLAAELADAQKLASELAPVRDELGRYTSQLEAACAHELNAIPQEKRAAIEAVVRHIPLSERLTAIQQMRAVTGTLPVSGGAITQPGQSPNGSIPGAPESAKPIDAKELGRLGWSDALKGHPGQSSPMMPDIKSLVDAAVKEQLAAAK